MKSLWELINTWETLFKEITGDEKDPKEFKQLITDFLIPDYIDPAIFFGNWLLLSRPFDIYMLPLFDKEKNIKTSKSLKKFSSRLNRPPGIPDWFLAAYPDVVCWMLDRRLKGENFLRRILGDINDDELIDDELHIRHEHLRTLIDTYCKETNNNLECSV